MQLTMLAICLKRCKHKSSRKNAEPRPDVALDNVCWVGVRIVEVVGDVLHKRCELV